MFNNSTRIPRINTDFTMRRMFFEHESHELHESQYFIGTRIVTDYHAGDKSNEPKERSVKICGICGKIKEEQDEQVPVHDGVSLSFAAVSLGCHRNTPDCTLPCLQMAIPCFQNHYLLFRNLYRSRFQHRFRYHHQLEGCYHRLEWCLQSYHHRMDSWSCCSLLHPHA